MKEKEIISNNLKYGVFRDKLQGNEYGDPAYILISVFRMEADARWYAKHRQLIQKEEGNLFIVAPVKAEMTLYPEALNDIAEEEEMIYFGSQVETRDYYSFSDAIESERRNK